MQPSYFLLGSLIWTIISWCIQHWALPGPAWMSCAVNKSNEVISQVQRCPQGAHGPEAKMHLMPLTLETDRNERLIFSFPDKYLNSARKSGLKHLVSPRGFGFWEIVLMFCLLRLLLQRYHTLVTYGQGAVRFHSSGGWEKSKVMVVTSHESGKGLLPHRWCLLTVTLNVWEDSLCSHYKIASQCSHLLMPSPPG